MYDAWMKSSLIGGPRLQTTCYQVDMWLVPPGVHHPDSAEVKHRRQCFEPADPFAVQVGPLAHLTQKLGVLVHVPGAALAQEIVVRPKAGRDEADRVELVIAHHRECMSRIYHGPNDVDHVQLLRAAIDQVAKKDGLPALGRYPAVGLFDVAQLPQERHQLACLTANVPDNVVAHMPSPA